ncbi:uncharacterized protein apold1a [Chanos chanos]|uniref:Uncharacterized protein apold1a n=1 Tax=Chanos chanos TaxID=29144 RepID=A0A6J2VGQ5_CHACN|nr:uncharacterized protein LOC115812138 [Chanos chanos]
MFRKDASSPVLKPSPADSDSETPQEEETEDSQDNLSTKELSASSNSLSDNNTTKEKGGVFSGIFKKQKTSADGTPAEDSLSAHSELSASNDSLTESDNIKGKGGMFSGMFKKTPKVKDNASAEEDKMSLNSDLTASNDSLCDNSNTKEKGGVLSGFLKKFPKSTENTAADEDNLSTRRDISGSNDNLADGNNTREKPDGMLSGIFRRSPKPAVRFTTDTHPLTEHGEISGSNDSLSEIDSTKDNRSVHKGLSASCDSLSENNAAKEAIVEEPVEMQELPPLQENTVEVEQVEMAAFPTEGNPLEMEDDEGLMEWWRQVEGWNEWNETTHFNEDEEEEALEAASDRVFMAARLFVSLFNQRGASLQQRILELLAVADGVDNFHKKTVSAAVGGGVASVVGSVATITGLILAPFTFGTSIIVTAVGIGVATAGSISSATANITDTVHAKMDRKKVEKMIQGYQEEIKDIRECLEFVQEGIDTLQEWNFEKYSESVAKKHLSHNIKHVMKEGGRAGKALMINTDKLISTVQVLSVAGGAAKAAQAISVTTGVMSALFLALDVFFLAKDSHELRKGAKTQFASKIRDVCKELQDGLLELNKVKTQLQKTMDGIELEEYEEEAEVEEEVEDDEDDLVSDPVKLAQLEQELDELEEKLDKETRPEQKPVKNKSGESERSGKISTSCFFASSRSANTSSNATDLSFELSGNSTGYIALGLAASQSMPASIVFVCGNDNTSFFFRTASNSNATAGLEVTNSPNVDSIQNLINGSLIQCTFTARNLSSTSFSLTLFEGTTNAVIALFSILTLRMLC